MYNIVEQNLKTYLKMSKIWTCSGNTYTRITSGYGVENHLPVGVYNIHLTMTGFHLERYADKFTFPHKIYGLQREFIDHVTKTFRSTEGNLGILLTGTKSTGKTVTAKELANQLNLPVIIVKDMDDNNQSMIEFLSDIDGDCILFLDEFEKNFDEEDSTILQIMDGVYNSNSRKVFLLTTNTLQVNENMIGRPSRIRYVKEFGNLDLGTVNEYLDDELKIPEARQNLLSFIDSLAISTIDILKAITSEVNIHGIEGLERAKSFFNVTVKNYEYFCLRATVDACDVYADKNRYTPREFVRAIEKTNNSRNEECHFGMIYHRTVSSSVKFESLKIGDFFDGDKIVDIDHKLGVVVVLYSSDLYYFWISNPDDRLSLYHKNSYNPFAL